MSHIPNITQVSTKYWNREVWDILDSKEIIKGRKMCINALKLGKVWYFDCEMKRIEVGKEHLPPARDPEQEGPVLPHRALWFRFKLPSKSFLRPSVLHEVPL